MARRRKEKFNYKKLASRPLPAAFHLLPPSYVLVQKLVRTKFGTPLGISITWFLFFSSFIFSFFLDRGKNVSSIIENPGDVYIRSVYFDRIGRKFTVSFVA